MPRRERLSPAQRATLPGIPTEREDLARRHRPAVLEAEWSTRMPCASVIELLEYKIACETMS
jgi:hypothetical protein